MPKGLLLLVAGLLSAADGLLRLTFHGRSMSPDSLVWVFDATRESSLPTWFSVVTMAALGVCCLQLRASHPLWPWVGAGCVYLSVDDACMLHERVGRLVAPYVTGTHMHSWVVVLGPVFAVGGALVAVHMWRALRETPARRAWLVTGMGALMVALGLEMAEDWTSRQPWQLRGLALVEYSKWLEETLETFAPSLLMLALPARRRAAAAVAAPQEGAIQALVGPATPRRTARSRTG